MNLNGRAPVQFAEALPGPKPARSSVTKGTGRMAQSGDSIPDIALARMNGEQVSTVSAADLLDSGRSVVIGIIGAYTPVCSTHHLPEFIRRAPELRKQGFGRILCFAPNDPWTVDAWAKQIDPARRILFISDGNLEFAEWLGVTSSQEPQLFVGVRSRRYLLLVEEGVISRFSVDMDAFSMSCTRASSM